MDDQFDSLAPRDIVITLRSIDRRIDGLVGRVRSDPELFGQIDSPGKSGASFGEILDAGARNAGQLARALSVAATATRKISANQLNPPADSKRLAIEAAQEMLTSETSALADHLDGLDADVWSDTVAVEGAPDMSVVDLSREVARRAIAALRDLEGRAEEMAD